MSKFLKLFGSMFALVLLMTACAKGPKVGSNSLVSVEYTGFYKDSGEQFDSNVGKQPLVFAIGKNQIMPAFEKALMGLAQGASKKISLKATEAYGEVDPKKVVTVPKDKRFAALNLQEGQFITANQKGPNGQPVQLPVKVVKLADKEVTLDYNHPLAGKDLRYEVKIISVSEVPSAEDIEAAAAKQAAEQATQKAPAEATKG